MGQRVRWSLLAVVLVACGGGGSGDDVVGDDVAPDATPIDGGVTPPDAPTGNSSLASLVPSLGTLDPPFEPEITSYVLTLPLTDDAVAFTAAAAVPDSTAITIGGTAATSGVESAPVALLPGIQRVDVVAIASGGATTTYQIDVQRGQPLLELSSAGVPFGRLTPAFDVGTTSYTAAVGLWAQTLQVTVVPLEAGSTITVGGTTTVAATPSSTISLNLGLTTIPVAVTTPAGATTTYTVSVTRAAAALQQAYVKASNTAAGDVFGFTVALSGDTLAVGATREDSAAVGVGGNQQDDSAAWSGAVYVFVRNGASWTQQAYLKASNTGSIDQFGGSIALSGNTLAVSALEDSNATGIGGDQTNNSADIAGAVYVFTRTGTTWAQQAYIKASNTAAGDTFGGDVALWGDTLAVGAFNEDSNATGVGGNQADNSSADSGAVYVFTRAGATWSQQAYIKASNPGADDQFGIAVALWGDTLAVGADSEDSSATGIGGNQGSNAAAGSGAVYVFTRAGTTWSQQAYLKQSNTGAGDRFGFPVALWGDTLAVGAMWEDSIATGVNSDQTDNTAMNAGAAYVFVRAGTTWTQQAYLKASNTGAGDEFGNAVAMWGDTVVVGAFGEASPATGLNGNGATDTAADAGAAYLFTRAGTSWTHASYLKASNTDAGDLFGYSVAVWGDTAVVGAAAEASAATMIGGSQSDDSAAAAGAVYVFR